MVTRLTDSSSSDLSIISSLDAMSPTSSGVPDAVSTVDAGRVTEQLGAQGGPEVPSSTGGQAAAPEASEGTQAQFPPLMTHSEVSSIQGSPAAAKDTDTPAAGDVEIEADSESDHSPLTSKGDLEPTEGSSPMTSTPSILSSWSTGSAVAISVADQDDSDEASDEISELSELADLRLSQVTRIRGPGSVESSEEAQSTIDSFLNSRSSFISNKENKLKLWQSLCIELGLVAVTDCANPSRASGPRGGKKRNQKALPPIPTSLTQAKDLLKQKAHVNINDYFEARAEPVPRGQRRDLSHLLHSSSQAMINYTVRTGNYTPKKHAKDEWLQPLMRDMRYARY